MTIALKAGDTAPYFAIAADGGGRVALADFQGKPLVLYFYPKDDTSGCTNEAKDFSRLAPEFRKAGVAVVGISPDGVDSHRKFRDKHDLTIALAADADRHVAMAYGVWVEKSMYGRTYMGVERSTFLIDRDGAIARIWRKVRTRGHAEQVLEAVKDLAVEPNPGAKRGKRS